MSFFGKGYLPDTQHRRARQKPSHMLLGASPVVPKSLSLEQYEAPIMDQGQVGSCGGHGSAQGVYTSLKAQGKALAWVPSPNGIYGVTRCVTRAASTVNSGSALPPLTDSGSYPADIMVGLAKWGVRPMGPSSGGRFSDCGPENVDNEPTLIELETDGLTITTGQYRIDESASDFAVQIQSAIALGYAVGIGVAVDQAFEDWNPSTGPITNLDQANIRGGHWLALTSYDASSTVAGVVFRGPNSWSQSWGANGHYEITAGWLASAASDIYVFNV